ncbi:FHA domain-containing protein [Anaerobacterium chartisolvens]|uniref:FHA domain-containing protein n=1 Tax=Anaerobacterium chartisolvens TaxID=1297424 RepID=A0A369AMP6_9FIRM|nr:DUF6382 domain-containing protein [Anaerobacterium chartisolvens]RCX09598.1 FHA domain-containing protein [Anaerobacterium chartisolvens]
MMNLIEGRFKFGFESGGSSSYMVARILGNEAVKGYQLEMISYSPSSSMLPVHMRSKDNSCALYYDITSKITLSMFLERTRLGRNELIAILEGIAKAVLGSKEYLLQQNGFLMHEDYIYINTDTRQIFMAYLPVNIDVDISKSFKELIIRIITMLADIEEAAGDNYIQRILGCIKQESFSIKMFAALLTELRSGAAHGEAAQGEKRQAEKVREPESVQGDSERQSFWAGKEKGKKQKGSGGLFQIPPVPFSDLEAKPKNKEGVRTEPRESAQRAGTALVLSQTAIIAVLAVIFASGILNALNDGHTAATYAGLIMIAGAADFLIIRRILGKKDASGHGGEEEAVTPSAIENLRAEAEDIEVEMAENAAPPARENLLWQSNTVFLRGERNGEPYLLGCGEEGEERIRVTKNSFIIGRLKGQVDHVCVNNTIGKIHAQIVKRGSLFYIKDLNSRNGTFINGVRMTCNIEYELKDSDRVTLANSDYVFNVPGRKILKR